MYPAPKSRPRRRRSRQTRGTSSRAPPKPGRRAGRAASGAAGAPRAARRRPGRSRRSQHRPRSRRPRCSRIRRPVLARARAPAAVRAEDCANRCARHSRGSSADRAGGGSRSPRTARPDRRSPAPPTRPGGSRTPHRPRMHHRPAWWWWWWWWTSAPSGSRRTASRTVPHDCAAPSSAGRRRRWRSPPSAAIARPRPARRRALEHRGAPHEHVEAEVIADRHLIGQAPEVPVQLGHLLGQRIAPAGPARASSPTLRRGLRRRWDRRARGGHRFGGSGGGSRSGSGQPTAVPADRLTENAHRSSLQSPGGDHVREVLGFFLVHSSCRCPASWTWELQA